MKVTKTQKETAVKMLTSGKATRAGLAKKYNVNPSTISKWKKALTPTTKTSSKTTVSKVVKKGNVSSVKSKKVVFDLTSLRKENAKLKLAYNTLASKVKEVYNFVA